MENSLIHSRLSNHILTFDPDLPINLNREEIAKALKENQVVIVTGDTGSGKTTQLPKICLDLGYAIEGQIGLTQPRRLAARTVAARIASEIGTPVGSHVGFKIRFEDQLSDDVDQNDKSVIYAGQAVQVSAVESDAELWGRVNFVFSDIDNV